MTTKKDYKMFWCVELRVANAQPILTQMVELWELSARRRIARKVWPLAYRKVGPGTVTIEDGRVIFDNAGWECETIDRRQADIELGRIINPDAKKISPEEALATMETINRSSPFGKENVTFRATVTLDSAESHPPSFAIKIPQPHTEETAFAPPAKNAEDFQPLFYLDQPQGFALAAQVREGERRHLLWTIDPEGKEHERDIPPTNLLGFSHAYALDGSYTIRIHQDGDLSTQRVSNYFEFWVERIPLGMQKLENPDFSFWTIPTRFHIGCMPHTSGDEARGHYLTGEISYLYFDPSSSCVSCPA